MDLRQELWSAGVIRRGDFLLKSGQRSDRYADFRLVFRNPKLLANLSFQLSKLVKASNSGEPFAVAGVPLGGVPYATLLSHILQRPLVLVRDKPKDHGADEQKAACTDIVLVEDVVTAGTSVLQSAKLLQSQGYQVRQVVCILDRRLAPHLPLFSPDLIGGIPVASLFSAKLFLPPRPLEKRFGGKRQMLEEARERTKSNLIAALDLVDPVALLAAVEKVGPYVCAIKLHLDIVDFSKMDKQKFHEALHGLKDKFGFLIIEDRKFGDIGSVNLQQLSMLPKWVDLVTCHAVTGLAAILELDKAGIGLLPVYQLSTQDNLIDPLYSAKVNNMLPFCKNVAGVISQDRVHGFLNLCPGINLDTKADGAGQTYRAPDASFADFFIVGRGLYQAQDISATAQRYLALTMPKPDPHNSTKQTPSKL